MLPEFLIAGAPRAGTTSLFRHMASHPQICAADLKEPWYFTAAGHRPRLVPSRWSWYESLFAHCPQGSVRGEASTAYFYAPESPELIRMAAPSVRLLFMLRDPVDRLYSHYLHDLRWRRLPPLEAMIEGRHPRFAFYVEVSRYAQHLRRFAETFSTDQMLVLLLEDLRARPRDVLGRAFRFVGVDDAFAPAAPDRAYNTAIRSRSRLVARTFAPRPLPWPALHRPWTRLAAVVRRLNTVPLATTGVEDLRPLLRPMFADDVGELERLIGRELEGWRSH